MAPRRHLRRLWPWLLAASAALLAFRTWQSLRRRLTPVDPAQAIRYGRDLTRRARRVLAVTAHPDDLALFVGGTLRLLALAGSRITVVVATGGNRQYVGRRSLSQVREQEERDAGAILGYDDLRFLGYSDLRLAHSPRFESELASLWERERPEVVFAFDPTAPYRSAAHPDHLAVGRAVLNIARSQGSRAPAVAFYGSRDPNVLVDISQVIEDKMEAIRCHRSELRGAKRFYGLAARLQAHLAGRSANVRYAEPLRYLSLPRLTDEASLEDWTPRRSDPGAVEARRPAGTPAPRSP